MTMTLRSSIARSLVKNVTYGLATIAALVAMNATASTEKSDRPDGWVECWNEHTAQIFVVQSNACPEYVR